MSYYAVRVSVHLIHLDQQQDYLRDSLNSVATKA